MAFDQVTCCNDLLPDHFLGCSHIAVSRAPKSQISARVIEIHRLKSFSVDCQKQRWLLLSTLFIIIYYQQLRFLHNDLPSTPGRKFLHNV